MWCYDNHDERKGRRGVGGRGDGFQLSIVRRGVESRPSLSGPPSGVMLQDVRAAAVSRVDAAGHAAAAPPKPAAGEFTSPNIMKKNPRICVIQTHIQPKKMAESTHCVLMCFVTVHCEYTSYAICVLHKHDRTMTSVKI